MPQTDKKNEGCEFTDPYLYSVFEAPGVEETTSKQELEQKAPSAKRRTEARLLFLLGLLPDC